MSCIVFMILLRAAIVASPPAHAQTSPAPAKRLCDARPPIMNAESLANDVTAGKDIALSAAAVRDEFKFGALFKEMKPPTILKGAIRFENCTFEKGWGADGLVLVFERPVLFRSCCFEGPVLFDNCRFLSGVTFDFCVFHGDVSLANIEVQGRTSFFGAQFNGQKHVHLVLNGSLFDGEFEFGDTRVKCPAMLRGIRVSKAANFARSWFERPVDFSAEGLRKTTFTGGADFRWSQLFEPKFVDTSFLGPAHFDQATLIKANFPWARFSDVSFRDARLSATVDFSNVQVAGLVNLQTEPPQRLIVSQATRLRRILLDNDAWFPSDWRNYLPFVPVPIRALSAEDPSQDAGVLEFLEAAEAGATDAKDAVAANQLHYRVNVHKRSKYCWLAFLLELLFCDVLCGYGIQILNPLAVFLICWTFLSFCFWRSDIRYKVSEAAEPKLEKLPLTRVNVFDGSAKQAGLVRKSVLAFKILTKLGFTHAYTTTGRSLFVAQFFWYFGYFLYVMIGVCLVNRVAFLENLI